ncbi:MAG: response regulator, partial [Nitrospirae bacterium]
MLVDDEASIRRVLSMILERAGYEVVTEADLRGGTRRCSEPGWEVILTDLILPDGNGIELMRCMRQRGSMVPVIAITGEPNLDTAIEAVRLGAYDYVSKPIRSETLLRVVERAVERYRLYRENERYKHHLERLVEERTGELMASERRYRELIEGAPEMIHQLDEEGRFLTVNRTQLETLGYRLEELLQRPLAAICPEDQADRVAEHLRRIREEGRSELATQFVRRDGSRLDVEIRASAVYDEDGSFLLSRGFAHDTTRRRRLEMQLIQADKLSTIGLMVSGVAHDVNNPLTGIAGYAEMLLAQGGLTPELESSLRFIYSEAERAGRIVGNLLSFVRQKEGERDFFDLHATIDAVLELMGYRLRKAKVEVERRFDPAMPALFGDMHQIQQVLLNLVNNAVQAMAEVEGARRLRLATRVAGGEACVEVADTGKGIEGRDLANIFDPFFTTKGEGEGTGLGLSITKAAVEAHGGR